MAKKITTGDWGPMTLSPSAAKKRHRQEMKDWCGDSDCCAPPSSPREYAPADYREAVKQMLAKIAELTTDLHDAVRARDHAVREHQLAAEGTQRQGRMINELRAELNRVGSTRVLFTAEHPDDVLMVQKLAEKLGVEITVEPVNRGEMHAPTP